MVVSTAGLLPPPLYDWSGYGCVYHWTTTPPPPPPLILEWVWMCLPLDYHAPPPLLYNWSGYGCVYHWTTTPPQELPGGSEDSQQKPNDKNIEGYDNNSEIG